MPPWLNKPRSPVTDCKLAEHMSAVDASIVEEIKVAYYKTSKKVPTADASLHHTLNRLVHGHRSISRFFHVNMSSVAQAWLLTELPFTVKVGAQARSFEQAAYAMNQNAAAGYPHFSTKAVALHQSLIPEMDKTLRIVAGLDPGFLCGWITKKVEVLDQKKRPCIRNLDDTLSWYGGRERNVVVEPLCVVLAFHMLVSDSMEFAMSNWRHTTNRVGAGKIDLPEILRTIRRPGYSYVSIDISGMEMNLHKHWYLMPAILRAAQSGRSVDYWLNFYERYVTTLPVMCPCGNVHELDGGNRSGFPDTIGSNGEITKALLTMLTYAVAHGISPDSDVLIDVATWKKWVNGLALAVVGDDAILGLPSKHSGLLVRIGELSESFSTLSVKVETTPGPVHEQVFLSCTYDWQINRTVTVRPLKILAGLLFAEGEKEVLMQAAASVYLDVADVPRYENFVRNLIVRLVAAGWPAPPFPPTKYFSDVVNTPVTPLIPQSARARPAAVLKSIEEPHKKQTTNTMSPGKHSAAKMASYAKGKPKARKRTIAKRHQPARRAPQAQRRKAPPRRPRNRSPLQLAPNVRSSGGGLSVPLGADGKFLSSAAMPQAYIQDSPMQRMPGFKGAHKKATVLKFCVPFARYGNSGSATGVMPGNAPGSGALAMVGTTTASFTQGFVVGAPGLVGNADTSYTAITGLTEMGSLSAAMNDISELYQRYRYKRLKFHFIPSTATTSSARSYWAAWISDPAAIIQCAAGTSTGTASFSYSNVYNLPSVKLFPAWQATSIIADTDGEWKYNQQQWASSSPQTSTLVSSVNYWRQQYSGVLAMFCDYSNASTAPILDGMVWAEGVVELVDAGADFYTSAAPTLHRACDIDEHPDFLRRLQSDLEGLGLDVIEVAQEALKANGGDSRAAITDLLDVVRALTGQRRSLGAALDAQRLFDPLMNAQWNPSEVPSNAGNRYLRTSDVQQQSQVPKAYMARNFSWACKPTATGEEIYDPDTGATSYRRVALKTARPDTNPQLVEYSDPIQPGVGFRNRHLAFGRPGTDYASQAVGEENKHLTAATTRRSGVIEAVGRHCKVAPGLTTSILTSKFDDDAVDINVPTSWPSSGYGAGPPVTRQDVAITSPGWFSKFLRKPDDEDRKATAPAEAEVVSVSDSHDAYAGGDGVFLDDTTTRAPASTPTTQPVVKPQTEKPAKAGASSGRSKGAE